MKITDLLIQLDQAINASTILNMVVQNMISLFNSVFFFFDFDKKNHDKYQFFIRKCDVSLHKPLFKISDILLVV